MRTRVASFSRLGAATLLFASACTYNSPPVLLDGPASDVAALAGTWEGTYAGGESQRTGTITFTIRAGKDTAYGDVLMETAMNESIVAADVESGRHATHARAPHVLLIKFVNVYRGYIDGTLEAYRAPDCDCIVETTFRGERFGEEIRGEFTTRDPTGRYQTGTWKVKRTRSTITER
jgi:hypothetical protein